MFDLFQASGGVSVYLGVSEDLFSNHILYVDPGITTFFQVGSATTSLQYGSSGWPSMSGI